jgi:hypothetical protein
MFVSPSPRVRWIRRDIVPDTIHERANEGTKVKIMSKMLAKGESAKSSQIIPWIALTVSICSLIVSYSTSLSAADFAINVSAPQWAMRAIRLGDQPNQQPSTLTIKLTCAFSNKGARTGVVNDLLLRLEAVDDRTKWLFYPAIQVDDAKFLGGEPKGVMGSVYPVTVAGKESQVFTYLFLPMLNHPDFTFGEIKPHKFRVAVLARTNGHDSWTTQQSFTLDLGQDVIESISRGMVMQQFPDEFDGFRRGVQP